MDNRKQKHNMSIMNIILITSMFIMLVISILISTLIFKSWVTYADGGLAKVVLDLEEEAYSKVDYHVRHHLYADEQTVSLNNYLGEIVEGTDSLVIVVDRISGRLKGNSINMDNYLKFQDGSVNPVRIANMGYPALAEAYNTYTDSKQTSFKLKNIESRLYINISEFKTPDLDWLIFTATPDTKLTAAIVQNISYTISLVVLSMATSLLAYYFIAKKTLKPTTYLVEATKKFSAGDFSQRVPVVRNDELGAISSSFNSMADTIHELVNNLEDKVRIRTLELEEANELVRENRNQLRLILDTTADAIYGIDIDGTCTFCNTSCIDILGYDNQLELIGKNMHYQIHHTRSDSTKMPIEECRLIKAMGNGAGFTADDEVFWRKDGTYFHVEYHVYPQLKDGDVVGAVVTFEDITETRKARKQIEFLSSHDIVTGLYNRMFFDNMFKKMDVNKNLPISIIYGDVNGLKLVNDIYGHEKGDELLKRTAEVMTRVCREEDIIARIGGDEFVILLANTEAKNANKVIKRIKSELAAEKIAGIKGSIALASDTKTSPDEDLETVYKNAETKMYRIKTLERRSINVGMLQDIMESLYEKSPREKSHSENVANICKNIAIKMDLPETDIRKAYDAGYYHDIGKIILDKNILNKNDKFTKEEKEEMKRHPMIGYRILNIFDETMYIAETVLAHHERWDGTGYPKNLKGKEIPLYARIVSVAKEYDSLTNRVDGSGLSHEEAIEEIKSQSGRKFDPYIVEKFLEIEDME